jgi:hypothetical protein
MIKGKFQLQTVITFHRQSVLIHPIFEITKGNFIGQMIRGI